MNRFFRIFNVFKNLYAKLIASAAIGVLLVAGLILNAQWSNDSISRADASSRNQNAVVKQVMLAQQSYLRGQILRRNIVLAHNLSEAQKAFEDMKAAGAEALEQAKAAADAASDPDNRARLQQFSTKLDDFMSISLDMPNSHLDIVKPQGQESHLIIKWNQAMQAGLALAGIKGGSAEPRMRDAATAMLDTNVAYWRYATLQEPVVLGKMYQAADKVYIELQRARSEVKDDKIAQAAIDGLLDVVQKLNDVIDGTKAAFDKYLKLDRERNAPLRAQLEDVIAKISTASDAIAHQAEVSVVADMSRSNRVGLWLGVVVMLVLIVSAIFSMLTFRRHAIATKEADARAAAEKLEAEARASEERKVAREKAEAERKAAMSRLADDFEQAVGKIVDTVSTTSMELESAAGASASEESSANVQSVASATDEMAASVAEISRQVQESSRIANEAVAQASKTDARISQLSQAAGRIGDVVKLITAIAEQTNLLALNATIEAARAGEAGKGFAVVAQEVKQLAAQTAKATDEIRGQIAGMQGATQESVAAIKEIGETIARISQIATSVASAVEEQGASTQEIARNVQQAAHGTSQVTGNITEVTRGASETGIAAGQVLTSAQSLANESNQLKTEVAKFLDTVRAA